MANVVNEKYAIIGEFDFDALIAGEQQPVIAKGVTLAAGQGILSRGTLLGIVTTTGLAVICDSTKSDGSQVPAYILALQGTAKTIDTGAQGAVLNVPTVAYQSGIFNRGSIITVAGQDIHTFEQQLRNVGILLRDSITNPTISVKGVALNLSVLALTAGGATGTLVPVFTPTSPTNQNVSWSNSSAHATVANGVVTPVSAGTAVITVTTQDGGYTATCTVTVSA